MSHILRSRPTSVPPRFRCDQDLFSFYGSQKSRSSSLAPSKISSVRIRGSHRFVAAAGGVVFVNKDLPLTKQNCAEIEEGMKMDAACYSHSPPDMPLEHYNSYREQSFRDNLPKIWNKVRRAQLIREEQFRTLHRQLKDSEAEQDSVLSFDSSIGHHRNANSTSSFLSFVTDSDSPTHNPDFPKALSERMSG